MDNNQIKLYIEQYIKSKEHIEGRMAIELDHFTQAISLQETQLQRSVTPTQIDQAWTNWKKERIQYIEHIKTFTKENAAHLANLARQRVTQIQPAVATDQRLAQDLNNFVAAYSYDLQHLRKQPLPEHIDIAWKAWLKGQKLAS